MTNESTLTLVTDTHARVQSVWREPPSLSHDDLQISSSPLLSAILHRRGVTSAVDAAKFLAPERLPLGDPMLLPDMERAISTIRRAIAEHRRIVIFGDYDVDGLTSTAMMVRVLRRLGANPVPVVPHRLNDGYGLSAPIVERLLEDGVELLITVDCGSSNHPEFDELLRHGVDIVVVDHHRYSRPFQESIAFVSPQRPENQYPFVDLAAVGVCYTLVRALLGDESAEMYLPYVALGTVADVVSLRDENRTLVANGLSMLQRWALPGMRALCASAGIDQRTVGAWEIGYVIGPRLNAAGRVDSPQSALDLLLADDATTATPLALRLSSLNTTRQNLTRQIQTEAESRISADGRGDFPAIVVSGEDWPVGIVGLVASRLAEAYVRPAIVFERGPDVSRGSARSAGVINVVEAIAASASLLDRFGGHRDAAGLSLPTRHLEQFEREFYATVADMLGGLSPVREVSPDAEINQTDLHLGTIQMLSQLEPFGHDNEEPLLLLRDVRHRYAKTSRDGRHLLFQVIGERGRGQSAVFFNAGHRLPELLATPQIDLATHLRRDTWDGRERLKMHVSDFRPSV